MVVVEFEGKDVNDFLPLTFLFQIIKTTKPTIIVNNTPRIIPAMTPPLFIPDGDDDGVDEYPIGLEGGLLVRLVTSTSSNVVL